MNYSMASEIMPTFIDINIKFAGSGEPESDSDSLKSKTKYDDSGIPRTDFIKGACIGYLIKAISAIQVEHNIHLWNLKKLMFWLSHFSFLNVRRGQVCGSDSWTTLAKAMGISLLLDLVCFVGRLCAAQIAISCKAYTSDLHTWRLANWLTLEKTTQNWSFGCVIEIWLWHLIQYFTWPVQPRHGCMSPKTASPLKSVTR